jgi:5-methylthioadenosine/S-adenosylhomocysteine deaminase
VATSLARELDLPASVHAGMAGYARRYRTVETLGELGLLGPGVNYAHANTFTDDEYRLIAESGGSISSCPSVELLLGIGSYPAVSHALEHGIAVGLGGDTIAVAQTDLFTEMRVTLATERSRSNADAIARDTSPEEVKYDHRDMLHLATLGGAQVWGLDKEVGSLAVGKRADLILIDVRRASLTPLNDPVNSVVLNAGPSDVDTVIVDGEIVKSGGVLTGTHADRARELVVASNERLVGEHAAA